MMEDLNEITHKD